LGRGFADFGFIAQLRVIESFEKAEPGTGVAQESNVPRPTRFFAFAQYRFLYLPNP